MTIVADWFRSNWSLLALIFGLGLAFVLLRSHPTEGIDSLAALDASIGIGQPIVIDFYSNF